jgi:hypothetical protein
MALYKMHSFELLWEKALDTKVLLAWSDSTCVLSFRGTSSWANVLADLEASASGPSNMIPTLTPTLTHSVPFYADLSPACSWPNSIMELTLKPNADLCLPRDQNQHRFEAASPRPIAAVVNLSVVQFWLAPFSAHEDRDKRRNWFILRPAVHHGFQRSWTANDLNYRVVERVGEIAAEAAAKGRRLRVITTGDGFFKTCSW